MRLTQIARIALGIAVLAGVGLATLAARDVVLPLVGADETANRSNLGGTRRTLVYHLDPGRDLRFDFSRPATEFKIISQPHVTPESWREENAWIYGFRVTLLDEAGEEIESYEIFSNSLHPERLLPFKRPERFRRNSLLRQGLQDDTVVTSETPVAAIVVRPLGVEEGIEELDVRVYERLPFAGNSALAAFRRRSPAEQAELAKASALPAELLTDEERAALMANRWKVLGPSGIAGRDYRVSVIYERPPQATGEENQ